MARRVRSAVMLAALLVSACSPGAARHTSATTPTRAAGVPLPPVHGQPAGVSLPPVHGRFSYQISGAYPPSSGVSIVDRDHARATLTEGLDDWVPLLAVHFAAEKLCPALGEPALCKLIVTTISELLDLGLIEIGTVSDAGFSAWSESADDVRERLIDAFATDDEAHWAFFAWLNNTAAGDAAALQAEASE